MKQAPPKTSLDELDDVLLGKIFMNAWKWCSLAAFTAYWASSLFPSRTIIQKEWKLFSLVSLIQSISTMVVIVLLLLYGRYISFTFNEFQFASICLAFCLAIYIRKNMSLMETICAALYIGLVGYAVQVQAKYFEFELILSVTR